MLVVSRLLRLALKSLTLQQRLVYIAALVSCMMCQCMPSLSYNRFCFHVSGFRWHVLCVFVCINYVYNICTCYCIVTL